MRLILRADLQRSSPFQCGTTRRVHFSPLSPLTPSLSPLRGEGEERPQKFRLAKPGQFPDFMRPVQTSLPFAGTYTAIATPFGRGGKLDDPALERLIKSQ